MPHITLARLLCTTALACACALSHAADLTVVVDNVQDNTGQVLVGLFDKAEAFPRTFARGERAAAQLRDAAGRVKLVFTGLAPGLYALSAFHDRDYIGKLNAIVHESDILKRMESGSLDLDAPATTAASPIAGLIYPKARLEELFHIFATDHVAIVVDASNVVGVISKIDLIEYLDRKNR